MATTTSRMGSFYNDKLAASQLRKYREKGAIASTQTLLHDIPANWRQLADVDPPGDAIGWPYPGPWPTNRRGSAGAR